MPLDLNDVPTDDLLSEVQRRMHCFDKPEKRVIMVGKVHQVIHGCMSAARNSHPALILLQTLCMDPLTASHVTDCFNCRASREWQGNTVSCTQKGALLMSSSNRRHAAGSSGSKDAIGNRGKLLQVPVGTIGQQS